MAVWYVRRLRVQSGSALFTDTDAAVLLPPINGSDRTQTRRRLAFSGRRWRCGAGGDSVAYTAP